jgi:hypothetical protein
MGRPAIRLLIIVAGSAVMAFLARDLTQPAPAVRAIEAGMREPHALSEVDAEDQNLQQDEEAAGAMWARAHPTSGAADCPGRPATFHRGCITAIGSRQ